MPSAPPAIFAAPAPPTPGAPGAVHAAPSASPAAIGAVHASPGIPSPSAPGAVHVVPVVGGDGSMRIGGGSLFYGATPVVFEDLPLTTPSNGRPRYFYNGVYDANLQWTGTYWLLSKWVPPGELATWYSYDDVATPDLATTWVFAEGYTSGIPTVTALGALAAPGAVHASPGIPSPSSPGAVHVRPSVLHPAAPPVITP